ncbi:MAG: copper amine oxidase N-terminal domain-containing protein, partial [Clostridia bacterium]|nr:copper amine oxidase N-terminal domain-containing protein [Clostridia bacterium]
VNGLTVTFDTKAVVTDKDRTMVPLRFVGEALGTKVDWRDLTVYITTETNNKEETENINGYEVPKETDLNISHGSSPDQSEMTISIITNLKDSLEQQYKDAENILLSKFTKEQAEQIINYAKQKTERMEVLELKTFTYGNKTVWVRSNGGNTWISIQVFNQ